MFDEGERGKHMSKQEPATEIARLQAEIARQRQQILDRATCPILVIK